jgi:outer membrane protein OmpA-like peptidoglycan-associated protein
MRRQEFKAGRSVSAGPAQQICWLLYRSVGTQIKNFKHAPGVPGLASSLSTNARPKNLEEVIMNHRLVIALPLAAILAIPALAQTTSSSSDQSQPVATQQQTQSNSAQSSSDNSSGNATGKAPLAAPSREGFWGRINPFARKKYVQRQTEPIRDRVNELDELTSQNSKMIKDVDSRATQGIKLASDKANEADQHAIDAGNKATQAQQSAQQVTTRVQTVENVVSNIDQYKASNQTEIRFRPGQTVLSKASKDALDQMAGSVKGQRGYIIEVQGFSSGKGQAAIETSQKMAESVVRYLVLNHDIPVYRIYLVGMGNAPAPSTDETAKSKRISGGRVEISLLKNDLEQLSSNGAAPAMSTDQQQQPK